MAENLVVRSSIDVTLTEQTIPFDRTPNKLTRETLSKSALEEEVHRAKDAKDLFEKLGIQLRNDEDSGVSGQVGEDQDGYGCGCQQGDEDDGQVGAG